MRTVFLLLLAAVLVGPRLTAATAAELVAQGDDHYFNLEHDQAIARYEQAQRLSPDDPNICTSLATAVLYKELNRLGLLDSSGLSSDNRFLNDQRPKPDPKVAETFEKWLAQAEEIATARIAKDESDIAARYALANVYALRANYEFMVDKSYFAALRNGGRARKVSKDLIEEHPEFVDGYLVAGVHEYIVGSLPWAVKALVAIGGIHGNKERGQEYVLKVISEGERAQTQARVLMALLHRREHRPLEAAELLTGLIEQFPRNYVLRLELASMYSDANQPARSLREYETVRRLIHDDAPGYGRVPKWQRDALDERLGQLREQVGHVAQARVED